MIEAAYDALVRFDASPVARLNHAVAVAQAGNLERGLELIDAIDTFTRRAQIFCAGPAVLQTRTRPTRSRLASQTEDPSGSSSNGESAKSAKDRHNDEVRVSAKVDYAIRAMIELAVIAPEQVKGERLALAQAIPHKFLENILADLRNAGLVLSQRGTDGGYRLGRDPATISVADVIRAVEGPIASVRGESPDVIAYDGNAAPLRDVWIELRAAMREVLEHTTLADLVARVG